MVSFNHSVPEESTARREYLAEQAEMLLKLAAKMKQNIATGDRRKHFFKKYSDCFTGMEAVDWMLEQMEAKSVAEAVRKGQGLLSARFIEKVDKEVKFEYSRKRFYRFTPTTPEIVHAPEHPLSNPALDIPLSAPARRRALAALIGAFVADAASTSLNGVSHPEKTIPNLLRADFDPAFCGASDSGAFGFFARSAANHMESSTGFEARVILQAIAARGHVTGVQLAKDAYWGFKNNKRMLSATSRSFIKRIQNGKTFPNCAVKCRSIDVLSLIPVVVALYAGTDSLFQKVDELVQCFYVGHRVRDAALVAAFILEQVILGASVLQAMRMSIRTERLTVKQRKVIFKAFTKSELPSYEAIQKFGNKGSLPTGFCSVLQPLFVLNDYGTAVRENIIGGGRTCRRAMFIGACFGAQDGLEAIPEDWVKKTPYFDFIETDAAMLVGRRDLKGTFYEEHQPADVDKLRASTASSSRPSMTRTDSTPYVDYTPDTVLTAQLLRASLSSNNAPPLPSRSFNRQRKNSIESGSSTPRSVASNFSYGSATTNGSSNGSVVDFGDMNKFYSSKATTPRSAALGADMMRFYEQNYAGSSGVQRRSSLSAKQFQRSSVSTARSSGDSNAPFSSGRFERRGSETMFFQSAPAMVNRMSNDLGNAPPSMHRMSSDHQRPSLSQMNRASFNHLPRTSFQMPPRSFSTSISQLSESNQQAYYAGRRSVQHREPIDLDDPANLSHDVVYEPRLSLNSEQVSMHAIL